MKTSRKWRLFLLFSAVSISACAPASRPIEPRLELRVKGHLLHVEVADTPARREMGLMFRKKMAEDEGMLFVFEESAPRSFWMKNTFLPLTIAFLDDHGEIFQLEDMEPETLRPHRSIKPCRYALEMRQGWFKRRGITIGDIVEGLPVPRGD